MTRQEAKRQAPRAATQRRMDPWEACSVPHVCGEAEALSHPEGKTGDGDLQEYARHY